MTRPKVDPANRQRTAQACQSCKRRKQKCNGLQPCNTCTKRHLTCEYGGGAPDNSVIKAQPTSPTSRGPVSGQPQVKKPNITPQVAPPASSTPTPWPSQSSGKVPDQPFKQPSKPPELGAAELPKLPAAPASIPQSNLANTAASKSTQLSGQTTPNHDEEAIVYASSRLLQDPKGRLLYIGESASLSCLQLIRMIVESVSGPTPFTLDPLRHRIMESPASIPSNYPFNNLLPDVATARVLVESFFINTNGVVEVFDQRSFLDTMEACYVDPLGIDSSFLCLLHLTLAIGLVLATPTPGSPEDAVIQRLRVDPIDRAEVFYNNAKGLIDPVSGFEDARLWSVQALLLMTIYLLSVARRNAAYSYFGMAVRFAFAIGIHREETMAIYSRDEQGQMRNLWRSLFVVDRFLAASLGRPVAISEDDCSGDVLLDGDKWSSSAIPAVSGPASAASPGLDASVRSSRFIGIILKRVYSKRKISTRLAQEIADSCSNLLRSLDPRLDSKNASSCTPRQGIAILHANLFYCHSIILLTRPFFLFLLNKSVENPASHPRRSGGRMEKFSEACIGASCHTITLIQKAHDNKYLPHRNPFVTYYLFAASLILLSSEYFRLCNNSRSPACIISAISVMAYSATVDPQARRLLFILTSFRDVVEQRLGQSITSLAQPVTINTPVSAPTPQIFNTQLPTPANVLSQSQPSPISPGSGRHPSSPSLHGSLHEPRLSFGRQGSMDYLVDLQSLTSNALKEPSVDGTDSLGEAEIEFEHFWNLSAFKGNGDVIMANSYDEDMNTATTAPEEVAPGFGVPAAFGA